MNGVIHDRIVIARSLALAAITVLGLGISLANPDAVMHGAATSSPIDACNCVGGYGG
jgi:hypothetical protein